MRLAGSVGCEPGNASSHEPGRIVGVISDTHGLIRPQALAVLSNVDRIIHAGDVGTPEVLMALRSLAPVDAVRGNNDRGSWALGLATTAAVEVAGIWLYVLHDLHQLDLDPKTAGFAAVIAGHSHRPLIEEREGVLFVNPGSAGPRRFKLPVTLARLVIASGRVHGEIVHLE